MSGSTYIANGIILTRKHYRESSLLCKCLTDEYGLVTIIAAGSNKEKSKLHGILEPFNLLSLELYKAEKSEIFNLRNAGLQHSVAAGLDYAKTMLLSAAGELMLQLSFSEDEFADSYQLLKNYCCYIPNNKYHPFLIYLRFVMKLFSIIGIDFDSVCNQCGDNNLNCYSIGDHGYLCAQCSPLSGKVKLMPESQAVAEELGDYGLSPRYVCLSSDSASLLKGIGNLDNIDNVFISAGFIDQTVTMVLTHLNSSFHKTFTLKSLRDYPSLGTGLSREADNGTDNQSR